MQATTVQTRLWWTEVTRGAITLVFGLLYLVLHTLFYILMYTLGIYLLCDGVLDLYHAFAGKGVPSRHAYVYLSGVASIGLGLLSLFLPLATLFLLVILIAVRLIMRGVQVIGEVLRSQKQGRRSRWCYALLLIGGGGLLLVPPLTELMTGLLVFFVGIYAFCDGLYLLGRGLRLCLAPTSFSSMLKRASIQQLDIPPTLPATTRRAIIFVRRSGAAGLGHIGWAFEWKNGWFNVGSIENYHSYAFAPAERADFWTAHTTDPLASVRHCSQESYDEYKLFHVVHPRPKAAWRVVVWISHLPYRVIRRNCVDAAYDILRTYGLKNLPDPATAYAPNDWYDSLPGPSYALAINPTIPVHIHRQSKRPLTTTEICLTIPPARTGTMPLWRRTYLRGLTELHLAWMKIVSDVQMTTGALGMFLKGHWPKRQAERISCPVDLLVDYQREPCSIDGQGELSHCLVEEAAG
jgi:uncharacterized membrane protein HdeD (DUF308 family)